MANEDIRELFKSRGIKQWQVAYACGVSEKTLIVWMRCPMSSEHRERVMAAVDSLTNN